MPASYPGAIKSWTPLVDSVDGAVADDVNTTYLEITAIQTELGTDVAASAADLKTRLAKSLNGDGYLSFVNATTLTISTGAVTPAQNFHVIDTQGASASDDLDNIIAPASGQNWFVALRIANDARNVVLKHNTGNLYMPGGKDYTLDLTSDVAFCIYDQTITKWLVLIPGALPGGSNTWTGYNYFNGGVGFKYSSVSADVTLDNTSYTVDVTTAANRTITLPAAATYPGIVYNIRKASNNAFTVTIDPDGSETINGASTYVISVAYENATIQSTGSAWILL